MSTPATVPMFAPDGTLGDIPYERMSDAAKAGAVVAIHMKAPDGSLGFIPANRFGDAVKAGGRPVPITADQPQPSGPGFLRTFGSDIAAIVKGIPQAIAPIAGGEVSLEGPAALLAADQQRKQEGRGALYRTGAGIATAAGANVEGMEQAAQQGNASAVLGHAAAGITPYAALAAARAVPEGTATKLGQTAGVFAKPAAEAAATLPVIDKVVQAAKKLGKYSDVPGQVADIWQSKPDALAKVPTPKAQPAAQTGEALGTVKTPTGTGLEAMESELAKKVPTGQPAAEKGGSPYAVRTAPEMTPVDSTNVRKIGYNPDTGHVWTEFRNGAVYRSSGVPKEVFQRYQDSESQGSFYARNIKGRYSTQYMGNVGKGK